MATLRARVEDYVGTFSDTDALDAWLTAGARKLIDLIPPDRAEQWAKSISVSAGGTAIGTYRILSAARNGYGATRRREDLYSQVQLVGSLWEAVNNDPAYIILNGKIYVFPETGTMTASGLLYPAVANTDSTIADYPNYFEQIVVLYAAIQALEQMSNDSIDVEEDLEKGQVQLAQAQTLKREYERCLEIYFGLKGKQNDAS